MPPSGDGFSVVDGCCSCCSSESNCLLYDGGGSSDVGSHSRISYLAPSSSNYSSLLSFDSIHWKDWEKLRRIILASAKGFTIGAGLKGGLALFSILARLRRRKTLDSLRNICVRG